MITSLYAAILGALFLGLSVNVIRARSGANASMGDGGDKTLQRRIRAQANCAEYAPLGLILLLLIELDGTGPLLMHLTGGLLVLGRVLHGVGFTISDTAFGPRVGGMALTLTALGLAVAVLLIGRL